MKAYLNSVWVLIGLLFMYNSAAQPVNDNCIDAINISDAFEGICGDLNTVGPFDNTNASHNNGDPMVPDCFNDAPPNGNSTTMERSVWFSFTVPDIFGNGDEVRYDITTSVSNSCDFENGPVSGTSDMQMVIYNAIFGCPNATTLASTYIACNDDITNEPPYIAGVEVRLMPGQTYYILVDTWNGTVGEFCLDIAVCGAVCGDSNCAANESYCSCTQDCACSALSPQFACAFQDDLIAFCGTNPVGDFIFCDTYFDDAPTNNVYVGFAVTSNGDCQNNMYTSANVSYSDTKLYDADYQLVESGAEILLRRLYFFEFTPADINNEVAIDIVAFTTLLNGRNCSTPFEINSSEIFSLNSINCGSCTPGDVDQNLNAQVVKEGDMIEVCTNGTENLNIACDSDDSDGFEYRWVVYADLDENDDFETAVTEPLEREACDLLPVSFLRDWFDVFPEGDFEILPPGNYAICGLALCDNSDGSLVKSCETNGCIQITLETNTIEGCTNAEACNYNEQANQNDDSCIFKGDTCDDDNINTNEDIIIDDCTCKGTLIINPVLGCTEPCFAEYNPDANQDDDSCVTDLTGCSDMNAENYNPDIEEDCADFNLCIFTDSDGDTVPDYREDLNGNDILEDDDTDEDGIPNFMDPDDDGDEILTKDEDDNGNGNLNDDDDDNDGIPNYLDAMAVGIETVELSTIIQPNPNGGTFSLSLQHFNKTIQIYNALGQTVAFTKKLDTQIELTNPQPGVYFLHLVDDGLFYKMLVQK